MKRLREGLLLVITCSPDSVVLCFNLLVRVIRKIVNLYSNIYFLLPWRLVLTQLKSFQISYCHAMVKDAECDQFSFPPGEIYGEIHAIVATNEVSAPCNLNI